MRKLEAQRGKTLAASFRWVDFVVGNNDIMSALTQAPLRITRISPSRYAGRVFGARLTMEALDHENLGTTGRMRILSDVRLPFGFGRTYTLVTHRYFAVDERTTSLDLDLSIELTRAMRIYVFFCRNAIDAYLNHVCTDIERAAQMLEGDSEECRSILGPEQTDRVARFRAKLGADRDLSARGQSDTEGLVRVAIAGGKLVMTVEAKMPDDQVLCALESLPFDEQSYSDMMSGTARLARINNNAFSARGGALDLAEHGDFRQAAFEFGYSFYRRLCHGQLADVLPALTSRGQAASMYLTVSGAGEELPWEALHDGHDFLCLKLRFSRSLTSIRAKPGRGEEWDNAGILIVGANPRGDLPGAEAEARDIGALLTRAGISRVEVLTGDQATRQKVIPALESGAFTIFHFSGHSLFEADVPYQSHLELTERSKIFLHEIGSLGRGIRQHASLDLAFLNSCQSALVGQDKITGRQTGLCRALREAGVGYVVGMLWNVEDSAAVSVGATFYRNLLKNPQLGPEEAMRRTRQRVATDRAWSDGSWLAPVLYA